MTIEKIARILNARIIWGDNLKHHTIDHAFASDLMSDVLTLKNDNVLLITGLANVQTLRTAEMSDIQCVIFARRKKITPEMKDLAQENNIIVLECDYSVFRTCGLLYQAGVAPIF
jgi:serine kinase of HPr protein (carbohydrate metabolism regulator)